MRIRLLLCVLVIGLAQGAVALAAPDEIQVYTEELNAPGAFGLERHLNYSIKGQQTPDYPGQMTPHHVLQITPEFSYGVTNTLEAGMYLPLAITPAGDTVLNGLRFRLKYIAPRQADQATFYGLNVEIGRDAHRTSDSISAMEIRPIIGYRDAQWLVSFNPILTLGLAANVSRQPQFEPALKVTHTVGERTRAGLEYYGVYGPPNHLLPADQRSHAVYAVTDFEVRGYAIDFGLGRGFANATDTWVMKAIIDVPIQ